MRGLGGKHALIMLACCLIPLGLLAAVTVFRVDLGTTGFLAVILLCPLLHVFMMRGMGHGEHAAHHQSSGSKITGSPAPVASDSPEQPVSSGPRGGCH